MKQLKGASCVGIYQTIDGKRKPVCIPGRVAKFGLRAPFIQAYDYVVQTMRDSFGIYFDSHRDMEIKYEVVDLVMNEVVVEVKFNSGRVSKQFVADIGKGASDAPSN